MKCIPNGEPPLIGAIQGYYLTRVLDALHRNGVLDAIAQGRTVASISRACGWDSALLTDLLEYVARGSDLIIAQGRRPHRRFAVSSAFYDASFVSYCLDQYVGAYGPCIDQLEAILHSPQRGASFVNSLRHAAAFSYADTHASHGEIAKIVQELRISHLLDLGCASAAMLGDIGQREDGFRGIGIDANRQMVFKARSNIRCLGLAQRIKIVHGDVFRLSAIISPKARDKMQAITAVSIANSFFSGQGGSTIEGFLSTLRELFPNRILILGDYFSSIRTSFDRTGGGHCLLHDLAQLVSGQGVPPSNAIEWKKIYKKTSCVMIKQFEGESAGIRRFIHIIQL